MDSFLIHILKTDLVVWKMDLTDIESKDKLEDPLERS